MSITEQVCLLSQFAGKTDWVHALESMVNRPRYQDSWCQHGAHLSPIGPRWAPCWPHDPCYQGTSPGDCPAWSKKGNHPTVAQQDKEWVDGVCSMAFREYGNGMPFIFSRHVIYIERLHCGFLKQQSEIILNMHGISPYLVIFGYLVLGEFLSLHLAFEYREWLFAWTFIARFHVFHLIFLAVFVATNIAFHLVNILFILFIIYFHFAETGYVALIYIHIFAT